MATYRNSDEALFERVRRYIKGLGYYAKPPGGIPASDLAGWVLPSAVTDKSVGDLGYTKNEGTVTGAKVNNVLIEDEDGVVDIGTVVTDVSGKQDVIDASHKLSADLVDDASATHKFVTASDKTTWSGKQDALVSGTNIKTINNESILGSGNITIQGGSSVQSDWNQTDNTADDFIKNKPTIPTESTVSGWGFTKNTGTVTSTNNAVTNIAVVSALPASPDANTLYLITGS